MLSLTDAQPWWMHTVVRPGAHGYGFIKVLNDQQMKTYHKLYRFLQYVLAKTHMCASKYSKLNYLYIG